LVLLALVPAISSAATFVVNTTADNSGTPTGPVCGGEVGETCTLREAIGKANADIATADKITFTPLTAGEALQVEETGLPPIYGPVSIEGDTAQGATAGVPALSLEPVDFEPLETGEAGITVLAGTGTRIEGLAIGGFGSGIEVGIEEGESPVTTTICGDYLGTDLTGDVAVPNSTGVEIRRGTEASEWPAGTVIGNGSSTCAENVIAGNIAWGIDDAGQGTTIAGNSIGIGAQSAGGPRLPNGTTGYEDAGIIELAEASEARIGGTAASGADGNLIAFNHGDGILVEDGASNVSIRHNYIFENEERGIGFAANAPAVPTIATATLGAGGGVEVSGSVAGTSAHEVVTLEFFGSPACDPSGSGEGQTFLGSYETEVEEGATPYATTIQEAPLSQKVITATVTRASGATSAFSTCASAPHVFTVNTVADLSEPQGCTVLATCSLREALTAADETEATDRIDFAAGAEGTIEPQTNLPKLSSPVEILGTSAPGYAGRPLVMIDGTAITRPEGEGEGSLELIEGLVIEPPAGGSTISGLAIGGFEYGIWLDGRVGSRLCASWVGVGLDGSTAVPNGVGVETGGAVEAPSEDSVENEIGAGCGAAAPNAIAGNSSWGIVDRGVGTQIEGNLVGIGPLGAAMPNGNPGEGEGNSGGGIEVTNNALGPDIDRNQIAYNEGPGVAVHSSAQGADIRADSIYGNAGKGIEIYEEAPSVPTIYAVTGQSGSLSVAGSVSAGDEQQVELDFYASAICSPLSAGVGETYLGTKTVKIEPSETKGYAESIATPISDDELYITVTATGTQGTSEFSECVQRPAPVHEEAKQPPSSENPLPPQTKVFIPKNGEKVVVKPEEGKVKIKLPGTKKYVVLTELKEIPVGAVIDATNGRVKLTSISPDGTEQTAEFFGGVFRVKQKEGSGLVVLELLDTTACPAPKKAKGSSKKGKGKGKGNKSSPRAAASSVSFRPKKSKTAGKLWGSGHGNFRTEGNDGSATVRGTIWLVEDRCDGSTFFKTRRGIVEVRDFIKHKSLPLPAGKTYLAGEE
jgi:CSLREA domain-containing protein